MAGIRAVTLLVEKGVSFRFDGEWVESEENYIMGRRTCTALRLMSLSRLQLVSEAAARARSRAVFCQSACTSRGRAAGPLSTYGRYRTTTVALGFVSVYSAI